MSLPRLVVTAVLVEGRPKAEVARTYGISRTWVHELVRRYETDGDAGLEPRSRRPRSNPSQTLVRSRTRSSRYANSCSTTGWMPAPRPSPRTCTGATAPHPPPRRSGGS